MIFNKKSFFIATIIGLFYAIAYFIITLPEAIAGIRTSLTFFSLPFVISSTLLSSVDSLIGAPIVFINILLAGAISSIIFYPIVELIRFLIRRFLSK